MESLQHLLLVVWPSIFASDFLRYALAAAGLVLLLRIFRRILEHRRIQRHRATTKDVRREIGHSLVTIVVFSLVGLSIFLGSGAGVFQIYTDTDAVSGARLLLELLAIIILHDAYFYWMHRTIHHPRLYRVFHRVHHLSRTPTPWAAYSFAIPEAIVEAAFLPLVLLFLPANVWVVFGFTTHMIIRNVIGHAGVELFPRRWLDWPLLRWITTTTHHDLHHSEFRHNYGLYFTWWDKLVGTEHPDYRERFLTNIRAKQFSRELQNRQPFGRDGKFNDNYQN